MTLTPQHPALDVQSLRRSFGNQTVIEDLTVRVEAGQRAALVGGNGSGKTTFIRCAAGTLTPTSGTIVVEGHRSGSIRARGLAGTSLAHERSFYLRLSGFENLLFFASLRHPSRRRAARQVHEIVEELCIEDIARRRVDTCSAGMVQQLAFARALVGRPRVLLLDEPTRSLDDEATARLWEALDRRPALALVIATHHRDDVDHCDRAIAFPT